MSAGDLEQRVLWLAPSPAGTPQDPTSGEVRTAWAPHGETWAKAELLAAGERVVADGVQRTQQALFTVRWRPDLRQGWRAVWRGTTFHVRGAREDPNGPRRTWLLVDAEEVTDGR